MQTRRAEWAERVAQWRRSGLTAKAFARVAGVNAGSLTQWAWRLKREGQSRPATPVACRNAGGSVPGSSFVELIPGRIEERRFELELVDGRRVRIPADFDALTLGRLLAVLGETRR